MGGRKRRKRGFNPLEKKPDDLGKKIVDSFENIFARSQAIVRDRAMQDMVRRLEQRQPMSSVIIDSIVDAYTTVAFDMKREMAEHQAIQERKHDHRLAQEAEEACTEALARDAANAAFPGVEDDEDVK